MEGENFYLVIGHWLASQMYRSVERSHRTKFLVRVITKNKLRELSQKQRSVCLVKHQAMNLCREGI